MTAAALLATLQARGVALRTDGKRIGVRPVTALSAEERAALHAHRAEVIRLLTEPMHYHVNLNMQTVQEVLGETPNPHAVACIRFEVAAAVAQYRTGTRTGKLPPRLAVYGLPLAAWLDLEDLARLLREGARQ